MRSVAHTAFPRVPRGVLGVQQWAWQLPAAAYPEVRLRLRSCLSSIREASSADNPHQILLRMQCRSFGILPLFRVPAHFPDRLVASNISVSCRGCTTNRKRNISLGGSAMWTTTHPGMNAVTSSGALHHLRLTLRPGIRLTSCSPETQSRQGTVPESTIHRVEVCENPVKPSFPQNVHRIFTILHWEGGPCDGTRGGAKSPAASDGAELFAVHDSMRLRSRVAGSGCMKSTGNVRRCPH